MQSTCSLSNGTSGAVTITSAVPRHVAIIMDGNGRWAAARGQARTRGHLQGARAVREVVAAAARSEIRILTLYAFSADNWKRPESEVAYLMRLFRRYLAEEVDACAHDGVRLEIIGRRDRLGESLCEAIEAAETATRGGERLHLRLAIDYSGRAAILRAARFLRTDTEAGFDEALARACHMRDTVAVDLLIRPGGEKRLSDFLLWESAYAELVFSDCLWPDFTAGHFAEALREFRTRRRRYGALADAPHPARHAPGVAHG